jgi:hypothetical protein
LLAATSTASASIKVSGATVDDESRKVGENRFRSTQDWEKTLRFYRSAYGGKPGYVWHSIETPPKVKAIHIENTHDNRQLEGINIYETSGEIFVFVIKADGGRRTKGK